METVYLAAVWFLPSQFIPINDLPVILLVCLLNEIVCGKGANASESALARKVLAEIENLTRYDININGIGISPRRSGELLRRDDITNIFSRLGIKIEEAEDG